MKYTVTKTYGHNEGLSCVFRQKDADSRCHLLHGYSLSFSFTFGCDVLNESNWCVDFGGLKPLKEELHSWFDHTLLVAADDPHLRILEKLERKGLADVRIMDEISVEMFAEFGIKLANECIWEHFHKDKQDRNLRVLSCTVSEHSGNSATAYPEYFADEEERIPTKDEIIEAIRNADFGTAELWRTC